MPGIFGCIIIDSNERLDGKIAERIFDKMSNRLKHLDSYAIDQKIDPGGRWIVGRIGHQELMAPDLKYTSGNRNVDTRFYGVLSGNNTELGRSISNQNDPLLGISSESGYFSAFCFDSSDNRLALVVDRRASEPLYYMESSGILYFAPEVKALLDLGVSPGSINTEGLASFLGTGYLLPHQTLFSNIKKLTSRHALVVEKLGCKEYEYWKYEPGSLSYSGSQQTMREELVELVKNSILSDFGTPEDTITFLSGGLDSRYILSCIARAKPEQVSSLHTVTWAEQVDIPKSDPEVASVVAKELGVHHQFKKRSHDEYETWFKETNYIQDGHSEVSAQHPHEYQIMKELHQQGFSRVLRGDEAFGLLGAVYSSEAALARIGIRPFSGIQTIEKILHKEWYEKLCSAGDAAFDTQKSKGDGMAPSDFKDVCYFSLRVPTYLSSAAYYKQVLFDHRNPLLANELMDFYQKVPTSQRLDKKLFFDAFKVAHPDLAKIPYSKVDGTEDWGAIMMENTPLRRMIVKELADESSGVWEIFDRNRVVHLFNNLSVSITSKKVPVWKKPIRMVRSYASALLPAQVDRMELKRAQARLEVSQLIFRVMIFKNWHDTFFNGR